MLDKTGRKGADMVRIPKGILEQIFFTPTTKKSRNVGGITKINSGKDPKRENNLLFTRSKFCSFFIIFS